MSATGRITFSEIGGWRDDDHRRAFQCWQNSAAQILKTPPKTRMPLVAAADLKSIAERTPTAGQSSADARSFFETFFAPAPLAADGNLHPDHLATDNGAHGLPGSGFLTGYYEPVLDARRERSDQFAVPLLSRPPFLVKIDKDNRPSGWMPRVRFGWQLADQIVSAPDRAAIEDGALDGQGLELAWLADPVDAYFAHIQGSARINFPDGEQVRLTFDGKTGHEYTSIGRLAVERGHLPPTHSGKSALEAWLRQNPSAARELMRENRSYIFFRIAGDLDHDAGPLGAAKVPLTEGRSLAVDRQLITFHTPIWIDMPADNGRPDGVGPIRRLMFAQDTGSAIKGLGRGDVFFGSGHAAGERAGNVRHTADMIILAPKRPDSIA